MPKEAAVMGRGHGLRKETAAGVIEMFPTGGRRGGGAILCLPSLLTATERSRAVAYGVWHKTTSLAIAPVMIVYHMLFGSRFHFASALKNQKSK